MDDELFERRIQQIREKVPIVQLLADFGYDVNPEFDDHEQQFPCDLHGDGTDIKPSARFYPESNSYYCFGCGLSRDAIRLVQEKQNLKFTEALQFLEKKFSLPNLGWSSDYKSPRREIEDSLRRSVTFEDASRAAERLLTMITQERMLDRIRTLKLWEFYDRVCWQVREGVMDEGSGKVAMKGLREKVLQAIK